MLTGSTPHYLKRVVCPSPEQFEKHDLLCFNLTSKVRITLSYVSVRSVISIINTMLATDTSGGLRTGSEGIAHHPRGPENSFLLFHACSEFSPLPSGPLTTFAKPKPWPEPTVLRVLWDSWSWKTRGCRVIFEGVRVYPCVRVCWRCVARTQHRAMETLFSVTPVLIVRTQSCCKRITWIHSLPRIKKKKKDKFWSKNSPLKALQQNTPLLPSGCPVLYDIWGLFWNLVFGLKWSYLGG